MNTCKAIVLRSLIFCILALGMCMACFVSGYAEQAPLPSAATPVAQPAQAGIIATVPVGHSPLGLAINATTNRVYVANYMDGTVSIVDEKTNTVIKTVPVGTNPSRIAVNPIMNRVYVADDTDATVYVLDGEKLQIITRIPLNNPAQGIAVNPVINKIYVAQGSAGENFFAFDGNANTRMAAQRLGDGIQDIAVNPITNYIYAAVSNQVSVIYGKSNAVVATVRLGSIPVSVAVDPITNRIYVTTMNSTLHVIDGTTNAVLSALKVGKGARGIAVNSTTNQVFFCNATDKTVSVFDGITGAVTSTISVAEKGVPTAAAINPTTNRVYVTMRETNTVCVLDGNAYLTEAQREYAKLHSTTPIVSEVSIPPFEEQFAAEQLDPAHWIVTRSEQFTGSTIDLVKRNNADRWLRLRLDTSKLTDMMKVHGVRTKDPVVDLEHPTEISFTLDWNNPANAEGMAAGIYLCPNAKTMAPGLNDSHNIKVMYYGGPFQGSKARLEVTAGAQLAYDEGYRAYSQDPTGMKTFDFRTLGVQRIRLIVDQNSLAVWENDKPLCQLSLKAADNLRPLSTWSNCYLFLQQESMVGHPACEVFFSNVSVRQLPKQPTP